MSRTYLIGSVAVVAIVIAALIVVAGHRRVDSGSEYRVSKTETVVALVGDVLMTYRKEIGSFPTHDEGLDVLTKEIDGKGPFMRNVEDVRDGWGSPLIYQPTTGADGPSFRLYSLGPNGRDEEGRGDDISFWSDEVQKHLTKN
jgi:general secretion pathway protein G